MSLFGGAVSVDYGGPKVLNARRPPGCMSRTGVPAVDHLEARLDLLPIPGFHGIEEEFHGVGHLDSMPSGQSMNQFPARLAEPDKLVPDDFSGHGCGICFDPGKAA